MLGQVQKWLTRLLEVMTVALVVGLTAIVVVAVIYRKFGASLVWYDEVASIGLAWVTYYGAALAALKRRHIGFEGLLFSAPRALRLALGVVAEVVVIGFFALLAWTGLEVLDILQGDTLVSLPSVPIRLTQSVIPIGALLFILAELISFPAYWARLQSGQRADHEAEAAP